MHISGSRWNGRGFRFVRSIPSLFKFSVIGTGDVLDIAPDMGGDNIYKEYL